MKQDKAQYVLRYINFLNSNNEELPQKQRSVILPIYRKVVVVVDDGDDDDDGNDDTNCSNYRGL